MAPEQAGKMAEVDHRADIYALGVVLYEMLTGERPGKDFTGPSRKVSIDVRLDEMVLRALEQDPELRYQTADEFRTVIGTMHNREKFPVKHEPAVRAEPVKRKKRRKKIEFSFPDRAPSKHGLLGGAFAFTLIGFLALFICDLAWQFFLEGKDGFSPFSDSADSFGLFPRLFAIDAFDVVFIIGIPVICFIVVVKSITKRQGGVSSGCLLLMFGSLVIAMAVVALIFAMIAGRNSKAHARQDPPSVHALERAAVPYDPGPEVPSMVEMLRAR
jgi:hypothetical protein